MSERRAGITALGRYVPERVVTNADLEKMVATSDEWIRTRTGISQRRYVEPGTPTSELAVRAAREALERRGMSASELDLIIVATVTPDTIFPATACVLQDKLEGHQGLGLRHLRRLLRVSLRPHHGRAVRPERQAPEGPGGGRRRDDLDPQLRGPHHLRALRRRGGRRDPRAQGGRHRPPRLHPRGGRLGGLLPPHARGGQRHARHPRDGGQEDALRAAAGPARLQVRGAKVRGSEPDPDGAERREARGHRPLRGPPGQPADHRRGQGPARASPRRRW